MGRNPGKQEVTAMYDSEKLTEAVADYMYHCKNQPTRQGLADWLCVSHQTVNNVINGTFNGLPYTNRPHINRIINNKDFALIRSLFKAGKEE